MVARALLVADFIDSIDPNRTSPEALHRGSHLGPLVHAHAKKLCYQNLRIKEEKSSWPKLLPGESVLFVVIGRAVR